MFFSGVQRFALENAQWGQAIGNYWLQTHSLSLVALNHMWTEAVQDFISKDPFEIDPSYQEYIHIGHIYSQWWSELINKPKGVYALQKQVCDHALHFFQQCDQILNSTDSHHFTDKRFRFPLWNTDPRFHKIAQLYNTFCEESMQFLNAHTDQGLRTGKQVRFFTKLWIDALSPSNFFWTNPEVIEHTIASQGENLLNGLKHFMEDFIRGKRYWHISMTDMKAFTLGENIACTPGKIVYQNRMMQLIQYTPTTNSVYERPLLIVPPWINKYYILDLTEQNSFVKWIVDQGMSVFLISWVNPDARFSEVSFEDYLSEGIMEAIQTIENIMQVKSVNALGFCIGGTLLACALGMLQANKAQKINSATFLTTMLDFFDGGDLEVFTDEVHITLLERKMAQDGYLHGRILMNIFNLIRANDLFWHYYVQNYLCGKNPVKLDFLYWNADPIHLASKATSFYLRKFYLENRLANGTLQLNGVSIDLQKVKVPTYFLSCEQDHIAPWQSTFMGRRCLGGENTFVLSGSGHIAGVVNPPQKHKYYFRYHNTAEQFTTPEAWLQHSQKANGSWWPHWMKWLVSQSGQRGHYQGQSGKYFPVIQEAPGTYVRVRID